MFYKEKYVFQMAYGDSGGNGGGTSNGAGGEDEPVINLPGTGGLGSVRLVDSPHSFTDPPRYFQANDPYYYEVDNVPIKQLQENCLWLKDQVTGTTFDISGVSKAKISDLQPFATGEDRVVNIRPGNFIGRVNTVDTGNLGSVVGGSDTVDVSRAQIFTPQGVQIDNEVFRHVVGENVQTILGSNGLTSHYQHHQSKITEDGYTLRFTPEGTFISDFGPISVNTLTKVQSAVWQQISNVQDSAGTAKPGLRQLSVDFTRRWGGVFRTSVVNVDKLLSIQVPEFVVSDYMDNNEAYTPTVRIDLVFLYTHPIDSTKSSTIAESAGAGPRTINKATVGIVKGAGGVLRANNGALDIANTPANIGNDPAWTEQSAPSGRNKYYDSSSSGENVSLDILSPLTDQVNTLGGGAHGFENATTYSFPSPDDLLNLAPLLAENVLDSDFAAIGQSVLPICYVIVKDGSPVITEDDIIDIRPFMRTAELTYSERSGLGAANPPVSLANPVVSKQELYASLQLMRNYLLDAIIDTDISNTENTITVLNKHFLPQELTIIDWGNRDDIGSPNPRTHFFTIPGLPAGVSHADIKYVYFRTQVYTSNGDPAVVYISNGGDVVDERLLGLIDGNGDDNRAEGNGGYSLMWPAALGGADSLAVTLRGTGPLRANVWVDAVEYESTYTINSATVG